MQTKTRDVEIQQTPPPALAGQDSAVPRGWTYNPSDWPQRVPVLCLALLNGAIATYLAMCQIWFHGRAWDPFFGNGTQRVLTSAVSQAFPVSDAALGAIAYLLEALSGVLGDTQRWRTRPWLTLTFGLLVLPLFLTSIALMILQPVAVHAWCGLCLLLLPGMLIMVPLALDEVTAALQFLIEVSRAGQSVWLALLHGGELPTRDAEAVSAPYTATMFSGYRPTWNLMLCLAIGIALLFLPAAQNDTWAAANSLYISGTLVVVISSLAFAEVARPVRFALMLCGVWLLIFAPFNLEGATNATKYLEMLAGVGLLGLSYPRGNLRDHYGWWERFLV